MNFAHFTRKASLVIGSPRAFAFLMICYFLWGISGPFVGFSDSWQIFANTATTLATTAFTLIIASTQNRDSRAVHLKLNEVLFAIAPARNKVIALEDADESEALELQKEFQQIKAEDAGE
jgi:low affinity Fe/Cu permease